MTFDGLTYEEHIDRNRLSSQLKRVRAFMNDGQEHTLEEIAAAAAPATEASVSARIRDLRKRRFGAHRIETKRVSGGLFTYRLLDTKSDKNENL